MSIIWNGVDSDTLSNTCDIIIEKYPALNRPTRKTDVFNVPGRSGDIVVQHDAFENYIQQYQIVAGGNTDGDAETLYADIAAWLYQRGYCQLEDSSEPGYYRMAYYAGPLGVENIMTRYGRALIEFNCMPYRYVKNVADIELTADDTITNSYTCTAKPLLKVYGTGDFEINGVLVDIAVDYPEAYVYIDCDSMQAYYNATTPAGEYVTIGGVFPELTPGSNSVTINDPLITKIVVSPRWRVL